MHLNVLFVILRSISHKMRTLSCCACFAVVRLHMSKIRKIYTGPTYKLFFSFAVISDVYWSFIPNKTVFTMYCLTQWISKLLGSFEIHWVRQYLVNVRDLTCIVSNCLQDQANFHRSRSWQIVPTVDTAWWFLLGFKRPLYWYPSGLFHWSVITQVPVE